MNSWQSYLRPILIAVLIFLGLFILVNGPYFYKQIQYTFTSHKTLAPLATPGTGVTMSPNTLVIPSLNIQVPIIYVSQQSEQVYQAALINGVVHYPGTADIGQVGNAYIFGHSSDYIWSKGHYKTVFALLPKIQVKAQVQISDAQGREYLYQVTQTKVVAANDLTVLSQDTQGQKLLTLQTSYPVGTALKRFVAICQLVE